MSLILSAIKVYKSTDNMFIELHSTITLFIFHIPYILTYRSQLFSHIFRPKTRVRPIRWSYLSENFHEVGTQEKLIGCCVHALVHALGCMRLCMHIPKQPMAQGHAPVITAYAIKPRCLLHMQHYNQYTGA